MYSGQSRPACVSGCPQMWAPSPIWSARSESDERCVLRAWGGSVSRGLGPVRNLSKNARGVFLSRTGHARSVLHRVGRSAGRGGGFVSAICVFRGRLGRDGSVLHPSPMRFGGSCDSGACRRRGLGGGTALYFIRHPLIPFFRNLNLKCEEFGFLVESLTDPLCTKRVG